MTGINCTVLLDHQESDYMTQKESEKEKHKHNLKSSASPMATGGESMHMTHAFDILT